MLESCEVFSHGLTREVFNRDLAAESEPICVHSVSQFLLLYELWFWLNSSFGNNPFLSGTTHIRIALQVLGFVAWRWLRVFFFLKEKLAIVTG